MALRLPNWEDLSKDEQVPIANLPLNGKYIVTGGPGTGKTILALYRAAKLKSANNDGNSSVSFLVYNKTLRDYLKQAVKEVGLDESDVNNWHPWFYKYYPTIAHSSVPEVKPYEPDWDIINENNHVFSKTQFNHLILDEAQDLPKDLLRILHQVSKFATVFADDNQSINRKSTVIAEIVNLFDAQGKRYHLSRNYRNSKQIFNVANLFYTGNRNEIPAECYRNGVSPVMLKGNFQSIIQFISNFADNDPTKNIGVFLPRIEAVNNYYKALSKLCKSAVVQFYAHNNTQDFDFNNTGVKVISYSSSKGLEFDAVFIPEIDTDFFLSSDVTLSNQLYVCSSRARSELFFSSEKDSNSSHYFKLLSTNRELLEWRELTSGSASKNRSSDIF